MSDPDQDEPSAAQPKAQQQAGAAATATTATPSAAEPDRRGALRKLVALGGLAYAGALAVPAASFVASTGGSGGKGSARWVRVGRLADLPVGEPRRLHVIGDERDAFTLTRDQMLGSVWLVREGSNVRAMSSTCPHLGCSIELNADKKSFGCLCHASKFSMAGAAQEGPSPRGMDAIETRVVDGFVEVNFKRFRLGIGDRQEVG